jgi:hypothetical protein
MHIGPVKRCHYSGTTCLQIKSPALLNLGLLNQEESAGAVNERQQTPLSTLHPPLTFPTVKKLNFRQWQLAG